MKKTTNKILSRGMTRREFVGRALAAGIISGAPAFLGGQNLNSKLNIAFIACGGRANASLGELTIVPGRSATGGGRRSGAVSGGPHPDENVAVLCDVNEVALDSASQRYPRAKKFTDLRRVFDRPNDFDAVVVSTAEHTLCSCEPASPSVAELKLLRLPAIVCPILKWVLKPLSMQKNGVLLTVLETARLNT